MDSTGEQLGIIPLREALRLASDRGLDLVEVAPTARPPVCRIMDYGKFKYEQSKKEKEARKKQKVFDVKELKIRPNIDDHDFEVRVRNTERFLLDGDKVKLIMIFRGREIAHANLGRQVLEKLAQRVAEVGLIERPPKIEGRNMIMILTPKSQPREPVREPVKEQPKETVGSSEKVPTIEGR